MSLDHKHHILWTGAWKVLEVNQLFIPIWKNMNISHISLWKWVQKLNTKQERALIPYLWTAQLKITSQFVFIIIFSWLPWLILTYSCGSTPIWKQGHVPQNRLQIFMYTGKILHLKETNKTKKKKNFKKSCFALLNFCKLFSLHPNLVAVTFISLFLWTKKVQLVTQLNFDNFCVD